MQLTAQKSLASRAAVSDTLIAYLGSPRCNSNQRALPAFSCF
jgi:hypothetical protein